MKKSQYTEEQVAYTSRARDALALRMRIRKIAQARPRFGYVRIWILPRREGWPDNKKRVHRLYRLEGLQVRLRGRRKITVDHGTEFTSNALDEWAYRRGVTLDFIRPASPWRTRLSRVSMAGCATSASTCTALWASPTHNSCSTPGGTITITSVLAARSVI